MARRRKKTVPAPKVPGGSRTKAVSLATPGEEDGCIAWRIAAIDVDHPEWGWQHVRGEHVDDLRLKLGGFEGSLASEFFGPHKGSAKFEGIDTLSKAAQSRLQELKRDDLDGLWCVRLSARERVWGTRRGSVFSLLWWDPNHTVCPSMKKHT